MDAVTAVSGSGPAYVFRCGKRSKRQVFLPDSSLILRRHWQETIIGAAALLDASEETAAQLRINVTSPGGATQAALEVLMNDDGMHPLLKRAVLAARDQSRTLGN